MKLTAHSSHENKIHCFTGNFFSPNHAVSTIQNYLCTIKSYLFQEGCMCFAYAYKLLSINCFQYSHPIHDWHCHGNRKGRAVQLS